MKTDVIEKMKYIETHYPVETIEYKGIKLWPFLRVHLYTNYYYSDAPTGTGNVSISFMKRFVRAIHLSSVRCLFSRGAVLLYTDTGETRSIDGVCADKTAAALIATEKKLVPILSIYGNTVKFSFKKFVLLDFFLQKYKPIGLAPIKIYLIPFLALLFSLSVYFEISLHIKAALLLCLALLFIFTTFFMCRDAYSLLKAFIRKR